MVSFEPGTPYLVSYERGTPYLVSDERGTPYLVSDERGTPYLRGAGAAEGASAAGSSVSACARDCLVGVWGLQGCKGTSLRVLGGGGGFCTW